VSDAFDVQQDGAGLLVGGEIVKHVAEIDVGHIAEGNEMRKADAARHYPIEHRRNHCARLADEGDISGRCRQMRKCRVEPDAWHHDADAVGTHDPQQMRLRGIECGPLQGTTVIAEFAEPCSDYHSGARPALRKLTDERRHALGRRNDNCEVRRMP
jgi:hypothetical protein